jgi:hypothetical protein
LVLKLFPATYPISRTDWKLLRFEKLDEFVMIKKLYEGLLIQLQEPLFDLNDPVHRMREEQILDKLDLDEFRHDK